MSPSVSGLVGLVALLATATVVLGLYTAPLQDWARRSLDILASP